MKTQDTIKNGNGGNRNLGYNAGCKTCNSKHFEEIHRLRSDGMELKDISAKLKNDYGEEISFSSLSRHFKHWQGDLVDFSSFVSNRLQEKATKLGSFRAWTDLFMERTFQRLNEQFNNLTLDFSDLERLAKLRVLLAQGDSSAMGGIEKLFERAADRYGIAYNQDSLFQTEPSDQFKSRHVYDVEAGSGTSSRQDEKQASGT